jgi:hypothetical protein
MIWAHRAAVAIFREEYAVQLNDTHPAIALAEMSHLLMDKHGMDGDTPWNGGQRGRQHEVCARRRLRGRYLRQRQHGNPQGSWRRESPTSWVDGRTGPRTEAPRIPPRGAPKKSFLTGNSRLRRNRTLSPAATVISFARCATAHCTKKHSWCWPIIGLRGLPGEDLCLMARPAGVAPHNNPQRGAYG